MTAANTNTLTLDRRVGVEQQPGDTITYPSTDTGEPCTGRILWVQAAGMMGDRAAGLRYVVEPTLESGFLDIVSPSEVLAASSALG